MQSPRGAGLGWDQSHYNQSLLWFRLHTTLAQITRIAPKWLYNEYTVLKIFSPFRIFEQLGLALKIRVCPENFHCIEYTFYIQDFWTTCNCPEKQSVPWIYCIEYTFFIVHDFSAACACSEKQSCPENFHCIEIFFIISDFWVACACPENRVSLKIFKPGGCRPPLLTPMSMSTDTLVQNFLLVFWFIGYSCSIGTKLAYKITLTKWLNVQSLPLQLGFEHFQ